MWDLKIAAVNGNKENKKWKGITNKLKHKIVKHTVGFEQ
jgi:hypothetical protein